MVPPVPAAPAASWFRALVQTSLPSVLLASAVLVVVASSPGTSPGDSPSGRTLHLASDLRLAAYDRERDRLFAIDQNDCIFRVDLGRGSSSRCWERHHQALALSLPPDGVDLAAGDGEGRLDFLDSQTGATRLRYDPPPDCSQRRPAAVSALAYHPDGQVLVAALADGTIRFHDAADGSLIRLHRDGPAGITCLTYRPSGDELITASADGALRLRDGRTGRIVRSIGTTYAPARYLATSPDGRTLAASVGPHPDRDRSEVLLFDLDVPARPPRLLPQSSNDDVTFTPGGERLIACGNEGVVRVWDVGSGRLVSARAVHEGAADRCFLTSDGRRVVTTGVGGAINVFDFSDGCQPTVGGG